MAKIKPVPMYSAEGALLGNGVLIQTPLSKRQTYADELKSGKSSKTGEILSDNQLRYRQGYLDGAAKHSYDSGVKQAIKDATKKKKRSYRKY